MDAQSEWAKIFAAVCRRLGLAHVLLGSWFIQAQIGSCLAIYKFRKMRPGRDWALSGVGRGSQYLDMPYSSGNNFNYFCFMDQQTDSHMHTHTHHTLSHTHTLTHSGDMEQNG